MEPTEPDCYRSKYVAFIDMLGFGQRIVASASDPAERKAIVEALELLRDTACANPTCGLVLTYFSDCIVLSADPDERGLSELFRMITGIADNLMQRGVFIRGGIAEGGIYHDEKLCFGPAMIRAYDLERLHAKHPCVLLDASISGAAQTYGFDSWLITDETPEPDRRYLNCLIEYQLYDAIPRVGGLVLDEPAALVRHHIAQLLLHSNASVRAKGEWMRLTWDDAVRSRGILPAIDVELDRIKPDAMASRRAFYLTA